MGVQLSAGEARRLGIIAGGRAGSADGLGRVVSPRSADHSASATSDSPPHRAARKPYQSRCCACGEQFTTRAAEGRHVAPGHARFEVTP